MPGSRGGEQPAPSLRGTGSPSPGPNREPRTHQDTAFPSECPVRWHLLPPGTLRAPGRHEPVRRARSPPGSAPAARAGQARRANWWPELAVSGPGGPAPSSFSPGLCHPVTLCGPPDHWTGRSPGSSPAVVPSVPASFLPGPLGPVLTMGTGCPRATAHPGADIACKDVHPVLCALPGQAGAAQVLVEWVGEGRDVGRRGASHVRQCPLRLLGLWPPLAPPVLLGWQPTSTVAPLSMGEVHGPGDSFRRTWWGVGPQSLWEPTLLWPGEVGGWQGWPCSTVTLQSAPCITPGHPLATREPRAPQLLIETLG